MSSAVIGLSSRTNSLEGLSKYRCLPISSGGVSESATALTTLADANRASVHFEKEQDAVEKGREISKNQGTEFRIHDKHGKMRESDSHGHDPYPPGDRKVRGHRSFRFTAVDRLFE